MKDYRDGIILYHLQKLGFTGDNQISQAALDMIALLYRLTLICEHTSNDKEQIFCKAKFIDDRWWFPLPLDHLDMVLPKLSTEKMLELLIWLDENNIVNNRVVDYGENGKVYCYALHNDIRKYL